MNSRTVATLGAAALLAGCMTPTWKAHVAGTPVATDTVILVGSFLADPPFTQERVGPAPHDPQCYGSVAESVGRCRGGGCWSPPGRPSSPSIPCAG